MKYDFLAISIVFMPLCGALLAGLGGKLLGDRISQLLTSLLVVIPAVFAALIFKLVTVDAVVVHIKFAPWLYSGELRVDWAIYIDSLTAVMLLLITSVSALVHIYSIGYMSHDEHKPRFMAYLSLFTFCMIMLVCADNFLQVFFGWEGVGLCSYLLIGFWYKKESANQAAMKAFLVNRVGDIGFALGIFAVFMLFGSIEFASVFKDASMMTGENFIINGGVYHALTVICILLFIGCMGKSAQLGLHTWLPDAMEGPTPVSALIHAATMVTAGVFLVARCSPLYEYAPIARDLVTIVGAVTCLFAATIALVQNDIKKIIAYSTCSQLGYMFFACGVSAYAAGIFHLLTHGFFKALLFLSAGSVIHAMSGEQDIRKMGGIWRKIPFTYACMWIGSLALAGFFPFAGFYSKDLILEAAFASQTKFGAIAYVLGIIAAGCTAFYSWRLLFLTFHGMPRANKKTMAHVHESPLSMLLPLIILAIGAIGSGYVGMHFFKIGEPGSVFWGDAIWVNPQYNPLEFVHYLDKWVAVLPTIVSVIGIILAYLLYIARPQLASLAAAKMPYFYKIFSNKWYFDEIYEKLFVRSTKVMGLILWRRADTQIIDGMPNGLASLSARGAQFISRLQTGYLYDYAFAMLLATLVLLSLMIYLA
jgi:NADH-quinone oxidoreductase subunit L